MSYFPTNECGCVAYQASTAYQYSQIYSKKRDSVDASESYHALDLMGKLSSGTEPQPITRIVAPFNSLVDEPVKPRQISSTELSLNIDSPMWTEKINNHDSPTPNPDDSPYSCQSRPTPCKHPDRLSPGEGHTVEVILSTGPCILEPTVNLAGHGDLIHRTSWVPQSPQLIELPELGANLGDPGDPENVQDQIMGFLWLDRHVESNGLPFVLQAYATWISRFLFEPLRIIQDARHEVFRTYALGEESRRIIHLIANSVYEITRSTDYNPVKTPSFSMVEVLLKQRFTEAGTRVENSRELDRRYALAAMLNTYEFTSALCKVRSLSTVLGLMQLAAPVFRRACPDSLEKFINLPSLFATGIMPLQYYSAIDVLLGVLTGRPMFFRYNTNFTREAPESLFLLEDGPGIRWSYGVPDQIVLKFAQMNALYEDFGPRVRKDVTDKLEADIKRMRPIVGSSTEPLLSIGRTIVQECWFLAALIYLYMGLCGANSTDTRVVTVRSKFMRILVSIRPKRHPDSFLVFPMVILGVATDDLNERNLIRQRMLGVAECSRPGTMENDFVRILDNIWSKRRPVAWSYLRQGCWEVSGW